VSRKFQGRYKKRLQEGECGGNLMYENGTMRPVETTLRMGEEGIKENDEGGEFN
jgi:hypothetical protein